MPPHGSKTELYALIRFVFSLLVLAVLAIVDIQFEESIPTLVYALIGGLNGVDLYNLVKEKKNG